MKPPVSNSRQVWFFLFMVYGSNLSLRFGCKWNYHGLFFPMISWITKYECIFRYTYIYTYKYKRYMYYIIEGLEEVAGNQYKFLSAMVATPIRVDDFRRVGIPGRLILNLNRECAKFIFCWWTSSFLRLFLCFSSFTFFFPSTNCGFSEGND